MTKEEFIKGMPYNTQNFAVCIFDEDDVFINRKKWAVGDILGAFYLNDNNIHICGGYCENTDTGKMTGLAIWEDDVFTIKKDGFITNQDWIQWKLLQVKTGKVFIPQYVNYKMEIGNKSGLYSCDNVYWIKKVYC